MSGTSLIPRTHFPRLLRELREWAPFEMMERMIEENGEWWPMAERFAPPVNMTETEGEVEVTVELPGLKPEEVKVEMHEGRLYISGEKKEEHEEKGKTFHRVERRYGEFRRVVPLPTRVKEENVEARFENGLLKVTLAKVEEAKPRHIEVKTS